MFLSSMRPYVTLVGCVRVHTTDDNDTWTPTGQELNECTSTEFNLVAALSTALGPPEDGRKCGPKHVGASF